MMDISIGLWTVDSEAMDPIYLATIIGMHIAIFGCEKKQNKKRQKERSSLKKKEAHSRIQPCGPLGCRSGFSI